MMALRASRRLLLGQFSRMLELGGAPQGGSSSGPIRPIDASKNSKVQAIAFDFDLLTRSVNADNDGKGKAVSKGKPSGSQSTFGKSSASVTPDMGLVSNIANLLNVDFDRDGAARKKEEFRDDLSGIRGDEAAAPSMLERQANTRKKPNVRDEEYTKSSSIDSLDIRAKYAAKLRNKVAGGLSGLDTAIQDREDALTKGDASSHLAARAAASVASNSKWLASTGTGNLLTYVTNRSIKVALLPIPKNEQHDVEGGAMEDFSKQLSNQVSVDVIIREGEEVKDILNLVRKETEVEPMLTMVVSDRDDYLKAAKDAGMITCRIRPANARRGNITAHHNVPQVADVQNVVNEINGISFNAVFASSNR